MAASSVPRAIGPLDPADAGVTTLDTAADTAAARAADLAARRADALTRFGPKTRTRTVADTFILVGASPASPLLDRAAALIARAFPRLMDSRFVLPPEAAVTVLLFDSAPAYAAYCTAHYGEHGADDYGIYRRSTREIVVDLSGGAAFLPTLTHEIVHPIMETDFPHDALWLEEGIASLFEAPVLTDDGAIHGEPRNWRYERLASALASPRERETTRLDALFGMSIRSFQAIDAKGNVDKSAQRLHYALARSVCAWLDAQGKLWPFYRTWRDHFDEDPTGEHAFQAVMGTTPREANAAWIRWTR